MSLAALMDRSGPLKARSNAARESVRDAEVNLAKVVRGHEWSCLPALRTAAKRNCFHKKKRMKEAVLQRVKGDNKRLKVALEVKEAELQRAKMHNSCLAAHFQGLKAELEEKEAKLAPMIACDWEIDSGVEWGLGDSEDRI